MSTCPLLRASFGSRKIAASRPPSTHVGATAGRWRTVPVTLLGLVGWRALQDLLNAIPDSNDDFGLF